MKEESNFVSIVAWIFIVLSGLATCLAVLQNLMFQLMNSTPEIQEVINRSDNSEILGFNSARFFLFLFLLLSLSVLLISIGLLKKKNWGRILFSGFLILAMVYFAASIFNLHFSEQTQEIELSELPGFLTYVKWVTSAFYAGLIFIFGKILIRLNSRDVKQSFIN